MDAVSILGMDMCSIRKFLFHLFHFIFVDGWMDGWMDGWIGWDGWVGWLVWMMDGWKDRRMDGWVNGWANELMDGTVTEKKEGEEKYFRGGKQTTRTKK
jgi:hypothetical protein